MCSGAAYLQRCTCRLRYGLNVADELPTLQNPWTLGLLNSPLEAVRLGFIDRDSFLEGYSLCDLCAFA